MPSLLTPKTSPSPIVQTMPLPPLPCLLAIKVPLSSSPSPSSPLGFYDDANILPCDSLLGISIYTLSFILTPLFIALFIWFISRIIETATKQLVTSRWYDAVASIVQKYTLELTHFEVSLPSFSLD
jgi:hypothetical protein